MILMILTWGLTIYAAICLSVAIRCAWKTTFDPSLK